MVRSILIWISFLFATLPVLAQRPMWADTITPQQKEVITTIVKNMVKVKGGVFRMGNPCQTVSSDRTYNLLHEVTVGDFFINKYELTEREYAVVMETEYEEEKADFPTARSWFDFQRFVERLNALSGLRFRMPTEAEWEYAAGGGRKSKHFTYAGSNDVEEIAWLAKNSGGICHPVGQKRPNELGLYDMTGNMEENVLDNYGRHTLERCENPLVYNVKDYIHVQKGGNYLSDEGEIYRRLGVNAAFCFAVAGMRLAMGGQIEMPEVIYPVYKKLAYNEIDTTLIVGVKEEEKTRFSTETWDEVLKMAQAMNKPVFVDCYTQWCGPCKMMDRYVFPTKWVGEYLNSYFINVKLDMESAEGRKLNKKYGVHSYPTFLILDPQGEELERFGGLCNGSVFRKICDSLIARHPEYDEVWARNPEPKRIDSTDYFSGRETKVLNVSLQEAIARAKKEGKKMVMLDCSTAWCGHCKIVEKYVFPLASVGDLLNKECVVNYMDMEGEEGKELGVKFNIKSYPVFLFLDLEGNEIGRVLGSGSAKVLKKRWTRAMKGFAL